MEDKTDIHVIPQFDDEPKHESIPDCWCNPRWDIENQAEYEEGLATRKVWVHNRIRYQ